MEYKNFLLANKPTLIEITKVNDPVLAKCREKKMLGAADLSSLEAEADQIKRNSKFWAIIETRNNCWGNLTSIFEDDMQNGVSDLLKKATRDDGTECQYAVVQGEDQKATSTEPTLKTKDVNYCNLIFNNADVKHEVLPKVTPDLLAKMTTEEDNNEIIVQIRSLGFLDKAAFEPVIKNDYRTQFKRMMELFDLIENMDQEEIKKCLEKICNLSNRPVLSNKLRTILNKHYQGCVQLS